MKLLNNSAERESLPDPRLQQLTRWLTDDLKLGRVQLVPASADASFRRYFRFEQDSGATLIAMDSPPETEANERFVGLAAAFRHLGLNVPEVLEADLGRGFLLISDLGSTTYLNVLGQARSGERDGARVARLYEDALDALLTLQACGPVHTELTPAYDRGRLMTEMELFREWYLKRYLGLRPGEETRAMLDRVFELLTVSALEQPQVCVHRDFHSRNLMVHPGQNPGILDFQDALTGAVTYDLVSLLRDCYIEWPEERVRDWLLGYHQLALQSGILEHDDEARFLRWFDFMGLQRHFKAIGIFARLLLRDGKPAYIGDIPRTLGYVRRVAGRYPELADLHAWMETDLPSEGGASAMGGRGEAEARRVEVGSR